MSGEGGPMPYSGYVEEIPVDDTPGAELGKRADDAAALIELPLELYGDPVDVLADIGASERGAIARRIGAIVGQFQREAREGTVSLSDVELRLVLLADDVRGGLHGSAE